MLFGTCSPRGAIFVEPLRYRPHREFPIAASCVASLDFDTERISAKPSTNSLPLAALPWISIPVPEFRAYDHSSWNVDADGIWLLCLQRASVWELASLGRGLNVSCRDTKLCSPCRGDSELPGVFAAALPWPCTVRPFISVVSISSVQRGTVNIYTLTPHSASGRSPPELGAPP
jgi:hypothetical protein